MPFLSSTGLQSSRISSALSHSASSRGFPIVALNPIIWRSFNTLRSIVIRISSIGPRSASFNRCISSIITTFIFFSHGVLCLINESNFSLVGKIKIDQTPVYIINTHLSAALPFSKELKNQYSPLIEFDRVYKHQRLYSVQITCQGYVHPH